MLSRKGTKASLVDMLHVIVTETNSSRFFLFYLLEFQVHLHTGSFAGLGFLSWYLAGKIRVFDGKGHVAKLCLVVVLPLLAASLVAISRVDDYWHHWQDVVVGGLIGLHV